jgi:hypothetical protein
VLAIDRNGVVVRDSGPINGLNPGGGSFGPDGRYYVGLRSARSLLGQSGHSSAQPSRPPSVDSPRSVRLSE